MMSDISHVRRNILLLLSGAIAASVFLFLLVTPAIIHFSPQAVREEQNNFYLFTPILSAILLTSVYVYLQPISHVGRYLRQGQSPPPDLAQRARTRAFSAPFYLFFLFR